MAITAVSIANFIIAFAGFMICCFSILITVLGRRKNGVVGSFFLAIFVSLLIYNISLLILELSKLLPAEHTWRAGLAAAGFCTYLFSVLSAFFFTEYVITYWEENNARKSRLHLISGAILAAGVFILFAEQMRGHLFIVYENGTYTTEHAHYLGYLLVTLFMVMDLLISMVHWKKLNIRKQLAFGAYIILPLVSILIRRWILEIYLVALASSLSMTVMLVVEIYEHTEEYRQQVRRNAQMETEMMISQIQPYVLIGVLNAIQKIGQTNPDKAILAIGDCERLLLHNITTMSRNGPIPFTDELDNAMLYISLERLRFGDDLEVHYYLTSTDFILPTLTMQPLVENAITNAVETNPHAKGSVTIGTDEYADRYEVVITDNGTGYLPDSVQDAAMRKAGIENIRNRLLAVCGGSLRIETVSGRGSTVTITLPKPRCTNGAEWQEHGERNGS